MLVAVAFVGVSALVIVALVLIRPGPGGGGGTGGERSAPAATPVAGASPPAPPASAPAESGAVESGAVDRGPVGDVRITSCAVDPATRWPSAELVITNRGGGTGTYIVGVEFVDASSGIRLAEGAAVSNHLAPGQRAQVTATALEEVRGRVACTVMKVDRFAP